MEEGGVGYQERNSSALRKPADDNPLARDALSDLLFDDPVQQRHAPRDALLVLLRDIVERHLARKMLSLRLARFRTVGGGGAEKG